jgi:hypothetical protein
MLGPALAIVLAWDAPGDTHTLPCRPTIACTADLVPPGAFELETGALYRRLDGGVRQWTFPFLAKLTFLDRVQLQVGSNGYTTAGGTQPSQYFDNVAVGVKLHVADQRGALPSLSLSLTSSTPVHDGGSFSTLATAYASKDFGPLHADLNVCATAWWQIEDHVLPQEWVALALSTSLPPPFGILAEGYYFTDASPLSSRDGGFLFALTHSPRPWLVFDAGGDVGTFPQTRVFSVFFGMSIVPVLFWRPRPSPT